jgi:hypothetical protein
MFVALSPGKQRAADACIFVALSILCYAGKLHLVDLAGRAWLKHACLGIFVFMQVKVGKPHLVDVAGSERLKHACLWLKPYLLCGQAAPGGFGRQCVA